MKKDSMAKSDAKKEDMASAGTVSVKELKMVAAELLVAPKRTFRDGWTFAFTRRIS